MLLRLSVPLAICMATVVLPAVAAPTLDDLFKAVNANDLGEVRSLLDRGMDPSSTDKEGYSLLMMASREGHLEMIRLLLDRKAKVNQRTPTNETAIMFAAFKGQAESVRLLHSAAPRSTRTVGRRSITRPFRVTRASPSTSWTTRPRSTRARPTVPRLLC